VAPIVIYRGQKEWSEDMNITAPSLRKSSVAPDPAAWTDQLLGIIGNLLSHVAAGSVQAKSALEDQLIISQQKAYQNPYVSCSWQRAIAQSFALHGDTPGYVLTISGDDSVGLDFQGVRTKFGLYSDSVDYLHEYGIPRSIAAPFQITEVVLLGSHGVPQAQVYP
jgi:hypothetical protein